jgi:hypothetical protein
MGGYVPLILWYLLCVLAFAVFPMRAPALWLLMRGTGKLQA